MVQWLRLWAPSAGGWASILVRELDPMCHKGDPRSREKIQDPARRAKILGED